MATFASIGYGPGEHPGFGDCTARLHHAFQVYALPNESPMQLEMHLRMIA